MNFYNVYGISTKFSSAGSCYIFQELAEYAEEHIEDTDPPLFLRFINLLINDAIYLLDEALDVSSTLYDRIYDILIT